jgi:UDP-N-acetyl-D-glucosamine dehydrogenase
MHSSNSTIGVVGLGYVGLPLLLAYAGKGYRVLGFDIDPSKIDMLLNGGSYIQHIPSKLIRSALERGGFDTTTDFSRVTEVDAIILCVPTPLDEHLTPDLSCVRDTLESVVPHLKPGATVSLESTTYPGTTEEEVVPRVLDRGLVPGETVFIVYSPEREDPGNAHFSATNIPKVVGGFTAACLAAGVSLYEAAFDRVVPVSSCRVAELSKLLENIYRAVNIGLVNEMKMVSDAMGINIWEVIAAAATKPFGFTPFYPGPGLGGHCIPIDPFYLTWKAKEFGVHTRFIELAGQVNRSMPEYVVQRTILALNEERKSIRGSKVMVLGLAYKPDVDDMRESPAFELMDRFADLGAEVTYHDPHIPIIGPTREHANWKGVASAPWDEATVSGMDVVVIATAHRACDYCELSLWAPLIVDARNVMEGIEGNATVVRA